MLKNGREGNVRKPTTNFLTPIIKIFSLNSSERNAGIDRLAARSTRLSIPIGSLSRVAVLGSTRFVLRNRQFLRKGHILVQFDKTFGVIQRLPPGRCDCLASMLLASEIQVERIEGIVMNKLLFTYSLEHYVNGSCITSNKSRKT